MSFDEIRSIFERAVDSIIGHGVVESEIVRAESRLQIRINGEYRTFLQTYGWGGVGSVEVFGLGSDVPQFLDLVRVTESERTEMHPRLAPHLLPVMNDGGGNLYCLDT